ncbi:alpha/beta fold hydrolase [Thermovibrio sp.]
MIYTLHGWSFSKEVWVGTPFEDAFHLELPGHGESRFKETDLNLLALEIGKEIEKNSLLVGWSLGASVLALTAYYYPEKVKGLILYCPTPKFEGLSQPKAVVRRFLRRLERDFKGGILFFRELCGDKSKIPILKGEAVKELLKSFIGSNLTPFFKELKVKTKILVGERDEITGVVGAFKSFSLIDSSSLLVFPEENHVSILKNLI